MRKNLCDSEGFTVVPDLLAGVTHYKLPITDALFS